MKENTTTYYCDATGEEIDNLYEMLVVTLHKSAEALENPESEIRLSEEAHSLDYTKIMAHEYNAYLDEDNTPVMVEVSDPTGSTYYGRTTSNEEILHLIEALDSVVAEELDS